jgi:hypothetical protein
MLTLRPLRMPDFLRAFAHRFACFAVKLLTAKCAEKGRGDREENRSRVSQARISGVSPNPIPITRAAVEHVRRCREGRVQR